MGYAVATKSNRATLLRDSSKDEFNPCLLNTFAAQNILRALARGEQQRAKVASS